MERVNLDKAFEEVFGDEIKNASSLEVIDNLARYDKNIETLKSGLVLPGDIVDLLITETRKREHEKKLDY